MKKNLCVSLILQAIVLGSFAHAAQPAVPVSARLGTDVWRTEEFLGFSGDSKAMFTVDKDQRVRLREVPDGKVLSEFQLPRGKWDYLLSRDGKTLAVADDALYLWDTATGKEKWQEALKGQKAGTTLAGGIRTQPSMAFSFDGAMFAVRENMGKKARLLDVATGKWIVTFESTIKSAETIPSSLAFTPDGKCLASWSDRNHVSIWETATGKEIKQVKFPELSGTINGLFNLVFSPDGRLITPWGQAVLVLDDKTFETIHTIERNVVANLAISADGKNLATNRYFEIEFWNLKDGKLGRSLSKCVQANYCDDRAGRLFFSPDGNFLACEAVHLWDLRSGKDLFRAAGHQKPVKAIHGDGDCVTTLGTDRTVRRWNVATGAQVGLFEIPFNKEDGFLDALSPDGKFLAVGKLCKNFAPLAGSEGGEVSVIELAGGKVVLRAQPLVADVDSLSWSGDSTRLVAHYRQDNRSFLFDIRNGEPVEDLTVPAGASARGSTLSPDGKMLAFIGQDGLAIWDFNSRTLSSKGKPKLTAAEVKAAADKAQGEGEKLGLFGGPTVKKAPPPLQNICFFTPDGESIVCQKDPRTLIAFETTTQKERFRMPLPDACRTLAYSPDGRGVAILDVKNNIRVLDFPSGREVLNFPAPSGVIGPLAFSSDARRLFCGCADTTVLVWDLPGR